MQAKDITNKKFGRLTAIRRTDKRDKITGSIIWECRCDCGNTIYAAANALQAGNTTSCGCYKKEVVRSNMKKNREKSYIDGTSINAITNKVRSDNTSGVKGIYWNKRQKNWVVRIGFKGKRYYIGAFKDLEDAKEARKEAEEKLYKPFLEEIKEGVDDGKK